MPGGSTTLRARHEGGREGARPIFSLDRWRRTTARLCAGAWERTRSGAWPVVQSATAATAAWAIAVHVAHHPQPFFAPIATVVGLNAAGGERGTNAVRLLLGVIVGIVVGELALAATGGGYGAVAGSTLLAMLIAVALGGERLVIAQAAVGAILTVASANGQVGTDRLVDALIGAGVALSVSQLLFPARPAAMLAHAEVAVLREMSGGLEQLAGALEEDDDEGASRAVERLRAAGDRLPDLGRTSASGHRTARRSRAHWADRGPSVPAADSGRLVLLANSALMLARTATALRADDRQVLAPAVRHLVNALGSLSGGRTNHAARQRAADQALAAAGRLGPDSPRAGARVAARMVVTISSCSPASTSSERAGRRRRAREMSRSRLLPNHPATARSPPGGGRRDGPGPGTTRPGNATRLRVPDGGPREETDMDAPGRQESSHHLGKVLGVCLAAAFGGLLFGFDTSVINGALAGVQSEFGLGAGPVGSWWPSRCSGARSGRGSPVSWPTGGAAGR